MQAMSDSVKATFRPASCAIRIASLHRRARTGRAPEIGLQIEDRRVADLLRIEHVGAELVRGAAIGVHRPLRVGRDQDQAAPGRLAAAFRRGQELDAERPDVVDEDLAELVVGDLADEAGRPPSAATPAMVFAAEPPLVSRAWRMRA